MPKNLLTSKILDLQSLEEFRHVISWQRAEGLALLGYFAFKFTTLGVAWWWLPLLLFSFDISIIGYLFGNKVGAFVYNLGHTSILAVGLLLLGYFYPAVKAYDMVGFLWLAHIGMDRAFGFGLKTYSGFRHTHLGMIGKPSK